MGKCVASLFQLMVNLLLSSSGLGVKCINILHEGRVGVEAPAFFTSYLFLFKSLFFSPFFFLFCRGIFS